MKKEILLLFFIFLFSALPSKAEQKKTIAILPFHNKGEERYNFLEETFPQILTTSLCNVKDLIIAEREVKGILEEISLEELGIVRREEIGALGADYLLEGDFEVEKGEVFVEIKINELSTGKMQAFEKRIRLRNLLIQDELSSAICQSLRLKFSKEKPFLKLKEKKIAVMHFRNNSNIKKLDPLQRGFADMLIQDLNKTRDLTLLSRQEMYPVIEELGLNIFGVGNKELCAKIGKILKADFLILGGFSEIDGQMRLDVRLVRSSTGEVIAVASVLGRREKFYEIEKEVAFKIIELFKIDVSPQEEKEIKETETKSLESTLYFYKALDAMDENKPKRAEMFLEDAVYLDTGFLRAQDYLGFIYTVNQDYSRALDKYQVLVRKFSEHKRFWDWKGYIGALYYELRRKEEAVNIFKEILRECKFEYLYPSEVYSQTRKEYKRVRHAFFNILHPAKRWIDEYGVVHSEFLQGPQMPNCWQMSYSSPDAFPYLLYNLARIYEELKDHSSALGCYLRIAEECPDKMHWFDKKGEYGGWLYRHIKEVYESKLSGYQKSKFEKRIKRIFADLERGEKSFKELLEEKLREEERLISFLWAGDLIDKIEPLSICQVGNHFYILHKVWGEMGATGQRQEVFLKEFNSQWQELQNRKLGFEAVGGDLIFYQGNFYFLYTATSGDGDVHLATFDKRGNLSKNIPLVDTSFDSEFAVSIIPKDDGFYVFYVRNYSKDCGLKRIELDGNLEKLEEVTFMEGKRNFHLRRAGFSVVVIDNKFYVAYFRQSSSPTGKRGIYVDCYDTKGNLIKSNLIDYFGREPFLAAKDKELCLTYRTENVFEKEGYYLYLKRFDKHWNLEKQIRIPTSEKDLKGEDLSGYFLLTVRNKTYLFLSTYYFKHRFIHQLYLKEIDF